MYVDRRTEGNSRSPAAGVPGGHEPPYMCAGNSSGPLQKHPVLFLTVAASLQPLRIFILIVTEQHRYYKDHKHEQTGYSY